MEVAIINGSTRKNAQSLKVAEYIKRTCEFANQVHLISLVDNPIPHWDESLWETNEQWPKEWQKTSHLLHRVDAVVVVSPEWGGMVPPALKNFFQMATHGELENKPALIVTVSSSTGGAYPVAELRMSSFKNTHVCYIPQHVIIRNVNSVLNDHLMTEGEEDHYIRGRLQYSLEMLGIYAKAFQSIRIAAKDKSQAYPYGM